MKLLFCCLLVCLSSYSFCQTIPETLSEKAFTIGETVEIESAVLDETRTLNIYLPASYNANSDQTYPVIYLLDGSADEDFIHIAGLVQFGSFSWINMLPETIVVGIGNVDRQRDFTFPTTNAIDKKDFPTTGHSEAFITFIKEELQPYINTAYKTNTVETLIGQSLGGLLATEILFKHPELFDNYIIVSPSLWWDDESLLDFKPASFDGSKSVYIAVGKEGEIMERTAHELYEKLAAAKNKKTQLHFDFLEDKTHGDALHIATYNAFEAIFRTEKE